MRKIIFSTIVLLLSSLPLAVAAPKLGIGIMLGQPTGLSAKLWLDQTSAIDAAAAWSFLPSGSVYVHGDYLYHIYHLFPIKEGSLPVYMGIGGSAILQSAPTIGLRFPVGIEYLFPKVPLDLFLEIGFGLTLYPATQFQGGGGIGIRYLL